MLAALVAASIVLSLVTPTADRDVDEFGAVFWRRRFVFPSLLLLIWKESIVSSRESGSETLEVPCIVNDVGFYWTCTAID